jgi:adenine deaminase
MRGSFIAALAVFALTASPVVAKEPADLLIRHATVVDVEHAQNYPGIGLHDELALYVDNGLTPAQALSSATRAGPAWFGTLDRYGAISPGKIADIVVLGRNPLGDIRATRDIHAVILRGTPYDRTALDHLLAATRAKVAAWNAADAK